MAILTQQFPSHAATLSPSTLALTCLLHDIGTTPSHLRETQLSFEFYGGFIALDLVGKQLHAPQSQAEAVAEAIIRHQDLGTVGTITFLGQLIQLATLYDNVGGNPEIVHAVTRENVNRQFPRKGWSKCFAEVIGEELSLKPWAHTTHLGEKEFPDAVLSNTLMQEYEDWE
jgi:cyanamide hydratase